ncbi:MAG: hypothetical protein ACOX1F_03645 [Erysipelotrichaceae bacterium]
MNFFEKVDKKLDKFIEKVIVPVYAKRHYIKFGVKMTWLVIKGLIVIIITIWWFNFLLNNS